MSTRTVEIWTDGGCNNKTGIGAWAAVILIRNPDGSIFVSKDGREAYREISGGEVNTTSSRMELTAAIMAIKALTDRCNVVLTTDSQYLQRGMNEWLKKWKLKNFKNAKGDEVANRDLWEELNFLQACHDIRWRWVRGHAGHELNERCDELCRAEISKIKERL